MPIRHFLNDGGSFSPNDLKVMSTAFDCAIAKLGLKDRADSLNELVAKGIISFAKQGERDSEKLCERVLNSLRADSAAAAK